MCVWGRLQVVGGPCDPGKNHRSCKTVPAAGKRTRVIFGCLKQRFDAICLMKNRKNYRKRLERYIWTYVVSDCHQCVWNGISASFMYAEVTVSRYEAGPACGTLTCIVSTNLQKDQDHVMKWSDVESWTQHFEMFHTNLAAKKASQTNAYAQKLNYWL